MQFTQQPFPQALNDADLQLFLREPKYRTISTLAYALVPSLKVIANVGLACIIVAVAYFGLNITAIQRSAEGSAVAATAPVAVVPQSALVQVAEQPAVATPEPTPSIPAIPENTLQFGDLTVSAPIAWDVQFDEKAIMSQLPNAVVHLAGTAKPGQMGSVVIFGHSSNYPWVKGNYNTVFAPLTQAKAGQIITTQYNGVTYQYRVSRTYEVKPSDLSALQASDTPTIRLITCVPLGTSLRRLVIEGEQITPNPSTNTAFTQANYANGNIPGN